MLQTILDLTYLDESIKINFDLDKLENLGPYWCCSAPLSEKFYVPKPEPLPTGTFSILVLNKKWTKESLFYPAFPIPLRWSSAISKHDKKLPKSLTQLADQIKDQLRLNLSESKIPAERTQAAMLAQWYLEPGLKYFPDLSDEDETFQWKSGTIPLAASLLLAALDGNYPPKPDVFASGSWDMERNQLLEVNGLSEKIKAAERLGGKRFFLPEINDVQDPNIRKQTDLKISRLSVGKTLLETVDELRRVWLSEPPDNASPEECERYYMRMEKNHDLRRAFYRKRLVTEIAHRARMKKPVEEAVDLFVSWVSTGAELINVAADYFKPKKIILLYTPDRMKNLYQETCQSLSGFNTEGICFDKSLRFSDLNQFLEDFFQKYQGKKIAIDLTLGMVPMTLALREKAPKGAVMVYWYKEGGAAFDIRPLSTEPEFIKPKFIQNK